ncbi:MAG: hypothetical protein OHK0013_06240 [Sandaracinaceae bacterium]
MRRPADLLAVPTLVAVLLSAVLVGWAERARAVDVEVDSDVSFQLYEVRAPGAAAFLARRRFVASLGVRLVEPLTEPDGRGRRVRLVVGARLRLDQSFAEDCLVDGSMCVRATDRDERADFQPLAADTRVDVPTLTVEVVGLPFDGRVRLGRQLRIDPVGFARFDGLAIGVRPATWIEAEAYGGMFVRGTTLGGSNQFDVQGPRYVPVDAEAPFLDAPSDAWLLGGTVRGRLGPMLTLALDARYLRDGRGEILRRASLAASSAPISWARFEAQGTLDLLDRRVIAALAAVDLLLGPATVRVSVDHLVPRFDPSTVWAWFELAPVQQLRIATNGRITDDLEIGGALRGRRVERAQAEDFDAGLELYARARVEGFQLAAHGFGWSGALGPVAGVALEASRAIVRELLVEAQLSAWHFDDPLRTANYGTVISTVLSALWAITEQSTVGIELQHAASRLVGHRFRAMLQLRVMAWR